MAINKVRLNQEITAPNVRLIGLNGEQLGIVSVSQALDQARNTGFDLAEIAPQADPPVVRILDWGKYRYEQTKQLQKSKKNQKQVEVKSVRLGLKTQDHDLEVKRKMARRFLDSGSKVRVALRFKGREITHPELGRTILREFADALSDVAQIEQDVQQTGREISITLGGKDAKAKNP